FDDSRYAEVPDDIRDLDPVGRSLMRGERRAALESQTGSEQSEPTSTNAQETPEGACYPDEFAVPPGYDDGQGYQDDGQGYEVNGQGFDGFQGQQGAGYDQQAYDNGQQTAYDDQQQQ